MPTNNGSTSIPIILGVTGHRDIPKEDEMVLKKGLPLGLILKKYFLPTKYFLR